MSVNKNERTNHAANFLNVKTAILKCSEIKVFHSIFVKPLVVSTKILPQSEILECIVQAPTDDESLLGSIVHEHFRQPHKRLRRPLNVRYMRYQWQCQEF